MIWPLRSKKAWSVAGWDEPPRGVFTSYRKARAFAESQDDFEARELNEDGTGYECYPFIDEYELDVPRQSHGQ